jgi:hypothetical protein
MPNPCHRSLIQQAKEKRKCIQKIEDGHDPDLDGYYMEECFPRIDVVIESLRKYFRFI